MRATSLRARSFVTQRATPPLDDADGSAAAELGLVERARHGDLDAFERLYRAHVGRVLALCLRMSGDAVRARELTQDVFVRLWERLDAFHGESRLSTWLHRLAVNVVLTSLRGDRRRRARVVLAEDGEGDAVEAMPAMQRSMEDHLDLEAAIAALPPGARTVFVLHDIEGYRHDEISKMTGAAPGTLRAQLHRARRLLMEALQR
jgi:RNA polymerase sigma-70 factor (ECF subfamily)